MDMTKLIDSLKKNNYAVSHFPSKETAAEYLDESIHDKTDGDISNFGKRRFRARRDDKYRRRLKPRGWSARAAP
jgi:hypothetical protein